LNEYLQEILNGRETKHFKYGERIFKLNDKVIQNSNNYDKNVFNGDLGKISHIDNAMKKFYVTFEDGVKVEYDFNEADQLTMAYAITIHKSQGSEFKVVIMLLLPQHYVMLKRNLLYTGMTRAKELLILIGNGQTIDIAINNRQTELRYNNLLKYLNN
jgi:exodeoxyribonuclease V alpha subunit